MTATHNTLALAFTDGAGRGTIRLKPKGPMRSNTFSEAVAAPTDKRGFVMPKFWGLVRLHLSPMVTGGMGLSARTAARLRTCLKHPAHPIRVQTQTVALVTPEGAKTMTTSPMASRSAAPTITPTTGNTPSIDPVALHGEVVNACAMARWYAARHRNTEAARKLRQALAALRRLAAFERAEVAA